MGFYVGDNIATSNGRSEILSIKTKRINQHAWWKIYTFSNGDIGYVKKTNHDCSNPMFDDSENMVFNTPESFNKKTS